MKANLLAEIEISKEREYISIRNWIHESYLNEDYKECIDNAKYFGIRNKFESIEGHKLKFINVNVTFDGRKKQPSEEDILISMERQGLVNKKGESIFGGFYEATDQLKNILDNQLQKRKELINQGIYEFV